MLVPVGGPGGRTVTREGSAGARKIAEPLLGPSDL